MQRRLGPFSIILITPVAIGYANSEEISVVPQSFVKKYESALSTQLWENVSPLIHEDAVVTFSNGSVHNGKEAVRAAYLKNFAAIQNEDYQITNVHWVLEIEKSAVYTFDFHWSGVIDGNAVSGSGRGTAVIVSEQQGWQLVAEHLGPYPKK